MERALIMEFEEAVTRLLPLLSRDNLAAAAALARLPLEVRGFGPVKQEAARRFRAELRKALAGLQAEAKAALH